MFNASGDRDIEAFYSAISPWSSSYKRIGISILSIRVDTEWFIYSGRISLGTLPIQTRVFDAENVFAITYEEHVDPSQVRGFLAKIIKEGLTFGARHIKFRAPETGNGIFSTHFVPYDGGSSMPVRNVLLRIFGAKFDQHENKESLSWQVMASSQPYGSFSELLGDFNLIDPGNLGGIIEVTGNVPCIVNRDESHLVEGKATITINALEGLDQNKLRIGLQIFGRGATERRSLSADGFKWESNGPIKSGSCNFDAPSASIVRIFLSYAGEIQNHTWIEDFTASPNVRRIIHQTFDPGFELLSSMLQKPPERRQDSREFEAAVGWLFWMLGFSPIAWSASKRLTDAPDLVMQSDDGTILVLEATIGTLRVENKLPNLIERTQRIRSTLERVGQHFRVLPILCTALEDDSIAADLDHAQSLGVGVISSSVLEAYARRTMQNPNSNSIVSEILSALENWQNRQQVLDGGTF